MEREVGDAARAEGRTKADGFGRYERSEMRLVVGGLGEGLREEEADERFEGRFLEGFEFWLGVPLVFETDCDSASFAARSNLSS